MKFFSRYCFTSTQQHSPKGQIWGVKFVLCHLTPGAIQQWSFILWRKEFPSSLVWAMPSLIRTHLQFGTAYFSFSLVYHKPSHSGFLRPVITTMALHFVRNIPVLYSPF